MSSYEQLPILLVKRGMLCRFQEILHGQCPSMVFCDIREHSVFFMQRVFLVFTKSFNLYLFLCTFSGTYLSLYFGCFVYSSKSIHENVSTFFVVVVQQDIVCVCECMCVLFWCLCVCVCVCERERE